MLSQTTTVYLDPCQNNDCDSNAFCLATRNSFLCECRTGFYGNGKYCSEGNCFSDSYCPMNEICSSATSLDCVCKVGFERKINGSCLALCSEKSCDENAFCSNTESGPDCECQNGYFGDGLTCSNKDLILVLNSDAFNLRPAMLINLAGSQGQGSA